MYMFVLGTNRFGTIALSCPALMLLMTHHEKNAAENFTVALTLTLGGMKVQQHHRFFSVNISFKETQFFKFFIESV